VKGKSLKDTPVREIMTSRVLYVRPDETVEECMALMIERRVRHLPVLDEGQRVGLIPIGDVVKAIIEEKDFIIQQLEQDIAGTGAWLIRCRDSFCPTGIGPDGMLRSGLLVHAVEEVA
jgi:predicted transcriptional regulator